MPELVEGNKAIALMEEQLQRSHLLAIEHLEILAANVGRFKEDVFCIFYHELQLRKVIAIDPGVDVEFARVKIRNFAEEQVSIIVSRDLINNHIAAAQLPSGKKAIEAQRREIAFENAMRCYNLEAIRKLRA